MDQNYPSNSDKSRNGQNDYSGKHVKHSVTTGQVVKKDTTWLDQIRDFFGLKECTTFRDYVTTIGDMTNRVYGAIDTLMGGRPVGPASTVPGARISYANFYNNGAQPQNNAQQKMMTAYAYDNIEFDLRADAERVLYNMYELLNSYPYISVGDLFDLAGISDPNGYVNQKYGWENIQGARVVQYGRKYRIVGLPTPKPLTR